MNNLKISLAEVNECAARIRAANQTMYELLSRMKKEMNDTNISWISEGGETIRAINVGACMPYINYEPRTLKEILESSGNLI